MENEREINEAIAKAVSNYAKGDGSTLTPQQAYLLSQEVLKLRAELQTRCLYDGLL